MIMDAEKIYARKRWRNRPAVPIQSTESISRAYIYTYSEASAVRTLTDLCVTDTMMHDQVFATQLQLYTDCTDWWQSTF